MLKPRLVGWLFLIDMVFLGMATSIALGQDYPSKPVRIVTTPVGGGLDFVARLMAQELTGPLGQPVIVDNRGGGLSPQKLWPKRHLMAIPCLSVVAHIFLRHFCKQRLTIQS